MPSINELLGAIDDRRRVTGRTLRDLVDNPRAFLDQIIGGARELSQDPARLQEAAEAAGNMFATNGGFVGPLRKPDTLFPRNEGMYTPGVPQVDLPRTATGRIKFNERTQALLDSRAAAKHTDNLIRKGDDLGMREWYGTEPFRQVARNEGLSEEEFRRLMAHLASASQRNPVDQQNRMGSLMWVLDRQGRLTPDAELLTNKRKAVGVSGPNDIALPPGYGSLAQGAIFDRSKQIASGDIAGALPPDKKLGTFYQNLLGNLQPVTVDVNAVKGPVLSAKRPDWLKTQLVEKDDAGNIINTRRPLDEYNAGTLSLKDALARPGLWEDAPKSGAEYKGFETLYQRAAKRAGMAPAEGQATGWYGSGDVAALKTKPELYVDNLERHVMETAAARNETPMQVLRDFLHGRKPLLGAGAVPALGDYGDGTPLNSIGREREDKPKGGATKGTRG